MKHCPTTRWIYRLNREELGVLVDYINARTAPPDENGCERWIGPTKGRYSHPAGTLFGQHFRPYRAHWVLLRGGLKATDMYRHGPCGADCMTLDHSRGLGSWTENAQDRAADRGPNCVNGHPYDGVDKRGWRTCSACLRKQKRGWYERQRLKKALDKPVNVA